MTSALRQKLVGSDLNAIYALAFISYEAELQAPVLMSEAEQATGLSDWGGTRWAEENFRERLKILCLSLEAEAQLTPTGRSRAHCRLHAMLCSRLRFVAWYQDADLKPIVAPLIGTGFPRAGTSFLHELIAQDPDNLSPRTAEAVIPVPPPGVLADESVRLELMDRLFQFQGLDAPEVNAIHPFAADAADECVLFQEAACGSLYQAFFNIPGFMAKLREDYTDLYDYQKGMMQVLQAGRSAQRWVLKTPEHMSNWSTMMHTFPDARIFMSHRDPAKVVPSIVSLFQTFQRLNSAGAAIDPKWLGAPVLAGLMHTMEQANSWRAAHPETTVVDVHYQDLIADPIAAAERVYAAFDMHLSAKARQCMTEFLRVNRHGQGQGAHAVKHRYTLAEFGLTEAMVEETCGEYIEQYSVVREKRD